MMSLSSTGPHQPNKFNFPKREYGKKNVVRRSFHPSWFSKWPWLHYVEEQDTVACYTCAKASLEKKLDWSTNADAAFITRSGFL